MSKIGKNYKETQTTTEPRNTTTNTTKQIAANNKGNIRKSSIKNSTNEAKVLLIMLQNKLQQRKGESKES